MESTKHYPLLWCGFNAWLWNYLMPSTGHPWRFVYFSTSSWQRAWYWMDAEPHSRVSDSVGLPWGMSTGTSSNSNVMLMLRDHTAPHWEQLLCDFQAADSLLSKERNDTQKSKIEPRDPSCGYPSELRPAFSCLKYSIPSLLSVPGLLSEAKDRAPESAFLEIILPPPRGV